MKTRNRIFQFKSAKLIRSRFAAPRFSRRVKTSSPQEINRAVAEPTGAEVAPAESSHDSYQLHLNEIGRVKLLTPEEEIALARRIKRGDKKAREQMITANLRLVVKIAREYEGLGVPLLDLINEGNIGLMKGVDRFDIRKGAKLSTYAAWWIKQSIMRALANQSKTIRLPVHVVDKLAQIRKTEAQLRKTLDREPTDEEVADEIQLDARRLRKYREASRAPVSLDAPVSEEDSASILDLVPDSGATAPFERLVRDTDGEMVREILGKLDARESKILALRFGMDKGEPKTLDEVGEFFGLTRERIRQIQEQALQKLRTLMEKNERTEIEIAA